MPTSVRQTNSAINYNNASKTCSKTSSSRSSNNKDDTTHQSTKQDNVTNLGKEKFDIIAHQPLPRKLTEVLLNR